LHALQRTVTFILVFGAVILFLSK